jgi:competence protein ComEC
MSSVLTGKSPSLRSSESQAPSTAESVVPSATAHMNCPLLALACALALGIALAQGLDRAASSAAASLAAASACLLAGLLSWRAGHERLSAAAIMAGFIGTGTAAAVLFDFRFPPNHISHVLSELTNPATPIPIQGRLLGSPLQNAHGVQFDLEAFQVELSGQPRPTLGKVRLQYFAQPPPSDWEYGDWLRLAARLRRPRSYRNPGAFDFQRWLATIDDVAWEGDVVGSATRAPGPPPPALNRLFARARRRSLRAIDRIFPPWSRTGRDGSVLKAILLGDRSSLDSETIENFRRSGLYHLLVIAGLHVGLLVFLAEGLLGALRLREALRGTLVLLFLAAYAGVVEQRAPTLRASLMIAAYLVARLLYRRHAALNAIGLSAMVLLLWRPGWLFESGFQLSFSAALLIAGLAGPILEQTTEPYRAALHHLESVDRDTSLAPRQAQFRIDLRLLVSAVKARSRLLERHPSWAMLVVILPVRLCLWTVNMLAFSAVLQLGLLLPMVATFHRVALAGIALNALAVPLMTVLLATAIPALVLGTLVPVAAPCSAKVVSLVLSALFALAGVGNGAGAGAWLSYRVPDPPAWVAWGFAFCLVAIALSLRHHRKLLVGSTAGFALFALLLCLHPFPPHLLSGSLELTALDCGDGMSLLVVLPDRTTLLIGAGGGHRQPRNLASQLSPGRRRWDPGESVVSPYLWSRGLKRINVAVVTDAQGDHLNGFAALAENFRIDELWHGPLPLTREYSRLLEAMDAHRVRIRQVAAGTELRRGTSLIQVVWPPPGSSSTSQDGSLVMRITDGTLACWFAGTKSAAALEGSSFAPSATNTSLLAVPYDTDFDFCHSSRLASAFEMVLFCGWDAAATGRKALREAECLQAAAVRVLRTDRDGAVTVQTSHAALQVHTMHSRVNMGKWSRMGLP